MLRRGSARSWAAMGFSRRSRRFENTLLLSPTRQGVLLEDAKLLDGVEGRGELFRHAMGSPPTTKSRFSSPARACWCDFTPSSRSRGSCRGEVADRGDRDGRTVVLGAFDAVYWTEQMARRTNRCSRQPCPPRRTDWKHGWPAPLPSLAHDQLTSQGWGVHDHAEVALTESSRRPVNRRRVAPGTLSGSRQGGRESAAPRFARFSMCSGIEPTSRDGLVQVQSRAHRSPRERAAADSRPPCRGPLRITEYDAPAVNGPPRAFRSARPPHGHAPPTPVR